MQLKFETSIVCPCRSEQSNDTKNTHAVFERLFSKNFLKSFKKVVDKNKAVKYYNKAVAKQNEHKSALKRTVK